MILRPSYQIPAVDAVCEHLTKHASTLLVMATGLGKCLARGTKVLMFDGIVKCVEDIDVGDLLMGPDSLPREVTTTASGRDQMFKITPKKGEPYTVNSDHILCLKLTTNAGRKRRSSIYNYGEIVDIPLTDYLSMSKTFKHVAKGFRVGVEFPEREQSIPPYWLGLWLGDGTSRSSDISNTDPEIENYLKNFAQIHGLTFRKRHYKGKCPLYNTSGKKGQRSPLITKLRALGVLNNKHVPWIYKCNSRERRLFLLAGLIDSDGCLIPGGGFEITVKQQVFAEDIAYLARSLGFAAYMKLKKARCQTGVEGTYFRVQISGDCSVIPTLIARKKSPIRRQKKNVLVHGIKTKYAGYGEYFGFTLDGDGRFLLGDFTVTHNTVVAAEVIKRTVEATGKMCLFLAHRSELIWQAKGAIEAHTGFECGIEMASERVERSLFAKHKVVISTVQTQIAGRPMKRMQQFRPEDFALVIIDESHRAAADSYVEIIAYYRQNPRLRVLGITATPQRADKESLGKVFESRAYNYGILNGVRDGWLVDVTQQFIKVDSLDWSECRTTAGDLNAGDVAKVVEKKENIAGICHPSLEVIFGLEPGTLTTKPLADWPAFLKSLGKVPRRTIVFTATVKQAEECCHIFNTAFPGLAEWVCGETDKDKRKNLLERFKNGRTPVCVNVSVLSEGYDNQWVEVIVMGKATKSLTAYTQWCGRGTRPLPGVVDGDNLDTAEQRRKAIAESEKPRVRIIDFVGNSGRHKLVNSMHVLCGEMSDAAIDRAIKDAIESKKPKRVLVALSNAEKKLQAEQVERNKEIERQRLLKCKAPKASYRVRDVDAFGNESFRTGERNGKGEKEIPAWVLKKLRAHQMKQPANYKQAMVLYQVCKKREETMPISESNKQRLTAIGYDVQGWTQARANRAWQEYFVNDKQKPLVSRV
jgi:superfamily II DNA or RNA helicase